ncbi:PmbA/TldA family metallopeptidase [Variovorax sp. GB1P17]|uniref:PmbA/TldA family metallopeptidase n=1 Tax=Variovorax sp. GB1P17 TaxID=3443740 RepID=UPI003F48A3A7
MQLLPQSSGVEASQAQVFLSSREALHDAATVLLQAASSQAQVSDVSVRISEALKQSVTVCKGELEAIEHSRSASALVTVFQGQRCASMETSDLSVAGLRSTAQRACSLARRATPDEWAGLADAQWLETAPPELDLFHPWQPSVEAATQLACEIEAAAFDTDARIVNSNGAGVSASHSRVLMMTSRGFSSGYASSSYSLRCSVLAGEVLAQGRAARLNDGTWRSRRHAAAELMSANALGRRAAQYALARIGARTLETRRCPVLFEARVANWLVRALVGAVSGRVVSASAIVISGANRTLTRGWSWFR